MRPPQNLQAPPFPEVPIPRRRSAKNSKNGWGGPAQVLGAPLFDWPGYAPGRHSIVSAKAISSAPEAAKVGRVKEFPTP